MNKNNISDSVRKGKSTLETSPCILMCVYVCIQKTILQECCKLGPVHWYQELRKWKRKWRSFQKLLSYCIQGKGKKRPQQILFLFPVASRIAIHK